MLTLTLYPSTYPNPSPTHPTNPNQYNRPYIATNVQN